MRRVINAIAGWSTLKPNSPGHTIILSCIAYHKSFENIQKAKRVRSRVQYCAVLVLYSVQVKSVRSYGRWCKPELLNCFTHVYCTSTYYGELRHANIFISSVLESGCRCPSCDSWLPHFPFFKAKSLNKERTLCLFDKKQWEYWAHDKMRSVKAL